MEEQGLLGFYFNYESNSSGIIEPPNQFVNNASFIAQNNQSYSYSHEIIFDGYELTAYDTIVAGVFNPSPDSTYTFQVTLTTTSSPAQDKKRESQAKATSNTIIWTVCTASGVLCIILAVVFVIRHIRRVKQRRAVLRLRRSLGLEPGPNPTGNPLHSETNLAGRRLVNLVLEPGQPRIRRLAQGQNDDDQMLAQLVHELLMWMHREELPSRLQFSSIRNRSLENKLTSKDIDLLIPTNQYSKFQTRYNTNCTICLEDFESDSICRQIIICHHIYHDKCIKEWLKNSQTCPNCKEQLTKDKLGKALEKNQENKKNKVKKIKKINLENRLKERKQKNTAREHEEETHQRQEFQEMQEMPEMPERQEIQARPETQTLSSQPGSYNRPEDFLVLDENLDLGIGSVQISLSENE